MSWAPLFSKFIQDLKNNKSQNRFYYKKSKFVNIFCDDTTVFKDCNLYRIYKINNTN